jgi:hypothetical protein
MASKIVKKSSDKNIILAAAVQLVKIENKIDVALKILKK